MKAQSLNNSNIIKAKGLILLAASVLNLIFIFSILMTNIVLQKRIDSLILYDQAREKFKIGHLESGQALLDRANELREEAIKLNSYILF